VTRNLTWTPFYSYFKREVSRFFKVIYQTIATPLISSTLYLLIFGLSIGQEIEISPSVSYLMFLIPGLVMVTSLRNAFDNAIGSIATAKFCGELEDLRSSPLSPTQIAWGSALAATLRGLVVGAITLGIGFLLTLFSEESWLHFAHPVLFFFFLILGSLVFSHIGLAVGLLSKNFEQVSAINTFILLPLVYLGGVFFSLHLLHPIWQLFSRFNPLLYMVNGVRYGMLGISDVDIVFATIVTIASWALSYLFVLWSLKVGSYKRW